MPKWIFQIISGDQQGVKMFELMFDGVTKSLSKALENILSLASSF